MNPQTGHKRALLKLSGGAFAAESGKPFDERAVAYVVRELVSAREICPELAVVVGGGNIMRGARFHPHGAGRIRADYAGMVATLVNAFVLHNALTESGVACAVYSALPVSGQAPPFDAGACCADLQAGRIVILAGGTGNPLFTTDSAAALRGVQLGVEIVLKATRVDGVYSGDPEEDSAAEFLPRLSYCDVLKRRLGVMDLAAVSLCMEHDLPVRVLNYSVEGSIRRALAGEEIGTLIGSEGHGH